MAIFRQFTPKLHQFIGDFLVLDRVHVIAIGRLLMYIPQDMDMDRHIRGTAHHYTATTGID